MLFCIYGGYTLYGKCPLTKRSLHKNYEEVLEIINHLFANNFSWPNYPTKFEDQGLTGKEWINEFCENDTWWDGSPIVNDQLMQSVFRSLEIPASEDMILYRTSEYDTPLFSWCSTTKRKGAYGQNSLPEVEIHIPKGTSIIETYGHCDEGEVILRSAIFDEYKKPINPKQSSNLIEKIITESYKTL